MKQSKLKFAMLISVIIVCAALSVGVCSCKAWRTVSTSATYVQQNDTSKTTTTIQTKTVEEYTGVKK